MPGVLVHASNLSAWEVEEVRSLGSLASQTSLLGFVFFKLVDVNSKTFVLHIHAYVHTYTHMYIHIHRHAHMYTHIHEHTHTARICLTLCSLCFSYQGCNQTVTKTLLGVPPCQRILISSDTSDLREVFFITWLHFLLS